MASQEVDAVINTEVKQMPKKWWKSKTFWMSVLIICGGVAEYIGGLPPGVAIPTIIAGCINIVLRVLTKVPIGK
tara:strand:- start:623 stop:844 length:222 start_codon:yes stop_codon:yes gene_type:complete